MNKTTTLNITVLILFIGLAIFSYWNGVRYNNTIAKANAIINKLETDKKVLRNKKSNLDLLKEELEQNRAERSDLQGLIEGFLEKKESLRIRADEIKKQLADGLGLK